MIKSNQIQEKLSQAIIQSKICKEELAEKLEITLSTLDKYISGQSQPTVAIFAKLCKILNLDANEILCIDEYK